MAHETKLLSPGRLYVVATPIGNRDDLSARAIATLQAVDTIACEDTRHSAPLLSAIGSKARLFALHDHNEQQASDALIALLAKGADLALISDAGTPLISDPGFRLVQKAAAAGFPVVPIPGPSALIAALSVAGLPSDRFSFEGFLPAKSTARRAVLQALSGDPRTLIWYEAPHRIAETLGDAVVVFGPERAGVIARELTKTFETVLRGSLGELVTRVNADPNQQRGEIVLLVAGAPVAEASVRQLAEGERIFALLRQELPASSAVRLAAAISGAPKNALYGLVENGCKA
ncbi:MAG: 16S rRNA (cytidine(1402)-2'-O)-methyltransferase [Lysobacterales bacterium]